MMQTRERFHQVMRRGPVDRVPLFDEGFRDDTLERWHADGLPVGQSVQDLFHYDARFVLQPGLYPTKRLRGCEDLDAFCRGLDPHDPTRWPKQWGAALGHPRDQCVIGLQAHIGLFQALGVEDWTSFNQALVLMADDPGLVREAMRRYAEFVMCIARDVLDRVQVDYVSFSEPIGATRAPLISPAMYRELALTSYQHIIEFFTHRGVETLVFTTYANARRLLTDVVDTGFTALWAMESESDEMDYRDIRREFGDRLNLIGGIDLDILMQGPDAIRRELSEKVPPLLESGGYLPLADGRVRSQFPFEHYTFYREQLERMVGGR